MSQSGDTFGPCYKCVHFYHFDGFTVGVLFYVCAAPWLWWMWGCTVGGRAEEGHTARLLPCSRATSWESPLNRERAHSPHYSACARCLCHFWSHRTRRLPLPNSASSLFSQLLDPRNHLHPSSVSATSPEAPSVTRLKCRTMVGGSRSPTSQVCRWNRR